jgi:PIN domain nuclease of toxin-antitoxin system
MLLDTCALLWLSHDQSRISDSTRAMIEKAPVVSIAAVTAFEVGLKHRSGKLKLPMPPRRWLDTVLSHHRIAVIGLDLEICLVATELPPIHKDPCDRFIIATALNRDLPVVTTDTRFAAYGVRVFA